MRLQTSLLLQSFTYTFAGKAGLVGIYKAGVQIQNACPIVSFSANVKSLTTGLAGATFAVGTPYNATLFTGGFIAVPIVAQVTLFTALVTQMDVGLDMVLTIAGNTMTGGTITFFVQYYFPL